MTNVLSALDASYDFPDGPGLDEFKAQGGPGYHVVYSYLTGYQSGKEWTAARLRLVHSRGMGAMMGFETTAGRPKGGYANGVADGAAAWRSIQALIAAVGYAPKSLLHVIFNADYDTTSADWPSVDAYLRGCAHSLLLAKANADPGLYGEFELVAHTSAAGTSHAEFQTYAWSEGKFFTGSELYQWSNNHHRFNGTIDYDQVIDAAALGAWWPPGHPLDKPNAAPDPMEEVMSWFKDAPTFLNSVQRAAGTGVLWGTVPLEGITVGKTEARSNTVRNVLRVWHGWIGNTKVVVDRIEVAVAHLALTQTAQAKELADLTAAVKAIVAGPAKPAGLMFQDPVPAFTDYGNVDSGESEQIDPSATKPHGE